MQQAWSAELRRIAVVLLVCGAVGFAVGQFACIEWMNAAAQTLLGLRAPQDLGHPMSCVLPLTRMVHVEWSVVPKAVGMASSPTDITRTAPSNVTPLWRYSPAKGLPTGVVWV